MARKSRKLPTGMRETDKQKATTLTKRRQGLFNKIAEICMLSEARVALLVSSLPTSKQKFSSFGYPSVDSVFDSFLENLVPDDDDAPDTKHSAVCIWQEIMGLVQHIQKISERKRSPEGFLVDLEEVEKSNSIQELQAFIEALEDLRDKAVAKMQMQCPQFQGSFSSNLTSIAAPAAADNNNRNVNLGYADNFCDRYKTGFLDRQSSSKLIAITSKGFWVPKTESAKTHCNNLNVLHESFPNSYLRYNGNNGSSVSIHQPAVYDSAIDRNMASNSISPVGNDFAPTHLGSDQPLEQDFGYLPPIFKKINTNATERGNNNGYHIKHDIVGRSSNNDKPGQCFYLTDYSNSTVVTDSMVAGRSHSDKDYVNFEPNFDGHDEAFLQAEICKDIENYDCAIDPGFGSEDHDWNWDPRWGVNNGSASTCSGYNHAIVDHHDHQRLPFSTYNGDNIEFDDFLV